MISLCKPEYCTGCSACYNICPVGSISMKMESEGFLYPIIEEETCLNCGLCERTCPILNEVPNKNEIQPEVYVSWSKDQEIRKKSSSGGIFLPLANSIIKKGGVVYGAIFDERFHVVHKIAKTYEECIKFLGSKYVQSDITNCFNQAKAQLDNGIIVLFSGTPCQINGLKAFLGKQYDNLLTCDFACHGVPSPGVFFDYLKWLESKFNSSIDSINFREKRNNEIYGLRIKFASGFEFWRPAYDDEYYNSFFSNFILRKSCYQCKFASFPRQSDITLGDFHGIDIIDNKFAGEIYKGVSVVLLNNSKGRDTFRFISDQLCCELRTFEDAIKYNRFSNIIYKEPIKRALFFFNYKNFGYSFARLVIKINLKSQFFRFIKPQIKSFIKSSKKFLNNKS